MKQARLRTQGAELRCEPCLLLCAPERPLHSDARSVTPIKGIEAPSLPAGDCGTPRWRRPAHHRCSGFVAPVLLWVLPGNWVQKKTCGGPRRAHQLCSLEPEQTRPHVGTRGSHSEPPRFCLPLPSPHGEPSWRLASAGQLAMLGKQGPGLVCMERDVLTTQGMPKAPEAVRGKGLLPAGVPKGVWPCAS